MESDGREGLQLRFREGIERSDEVMLHGNPPCKNDVLHARFKPPFFVN